MRGVRLKVARRNGVGSGVCECGCGQPAPVAEKTDRTFGYVKGLPKRFIVGHRIYAGNIKPRPRRYNITTDGYAAIGGDREHILIAEMVLGRPMPKGAEVHHVNRIKTDNSPGNLVICQGHAYHALLHRRQRALDACGHADWKRCMHCGQWDDPANMTVVSTRSHMAYHKTCNAARQREYKIRRGAA